VGPDLTTEAVVAVCRRSLGWVLDGFPNTKQQAEALHGAGLGLNFVVRLSADAASCERRAGLKFATLKGSDTRREHPKLDHLGITKIRTAVWDADGDGIVTTLCAQRDILVTADATKSKHHVHHVMNCALGAAQRDRHNHLVSKRLHPAAPMRGMQFWYDMPTLSAMESSLRDYCPVSLVLHKMLVVCPKIDHGAEFRRKRYSLCGPECLALFLAQPSRYLAGVKLPTVLPERLSPQQAQEVPPDQLQYKGHCPVTLADGPMQGKPVQSAVLPGRPELVVSYAGLHFTFADEAKVDRFMRNPVPFTKLKLPTKLPPRKDDDFDVNLLPLAGYLEHSVVKALTDGLISLGTCKPVFPYMGTKESAMKYLALYLRAHNGANSQLSQGRHSANFKAYVECCDMLHRAKAEEEFTPQEIQRVEQVKDQGLKAVLRQ